VSAPLEPGTGGDGASAAREGFGLRAVLFGLAGTAVLTGPWLVGLDVAPWRGVDGALVALLLVGAVCFGWPSVGRRGGAEALTDLSVGAASLIPFGVLGASAAGEAAGTSGALLVAGGLWMAFVWTGRLGGWPGAAAAVVLVGWMSQGGDDEEPAPAPGPPVQMLPVDLALTGPLDAARLRVGDAPPLEIRADLGVGASRQVRTWLPVPAERPPGVVSPLAEALSPPGLGRDVAPGAQGSDGRVRATMASPWSPDPELAARQRPPVPTPVRRPPAAAGLLGAWAALLLAIAVRRAWGRRRPWAGVAGGAALGAGAGLLFFQLFHPASGLTIRPPGQLGPGVRVLEGVAGASKWLQVDRRRGALRLEGLGSGPAAIELHGRPPRRCTLDLSGAGGRFELLLGAGAVADLLRPLDPGLRPLQPAINGWGDMDPAWLRGGAGGWRNAAPWRLGEGQAPPARGAAGGHPGPMAAPPAWGLGGVDGPGWVVLGCLAGEGFSGLQGPQAVPAAGSAGAGVGEEVWIRVTGGASGEGR
jgi:hypothetical protein